MAWRQKTLGGVTGFVRGDPPWLVLVHGFAGAPWDWCRVLTELGSETPVALVELPGHGPQRRKQPPGWTEVVEGLQAWLEQSDRAVGYSMGGRLLISALSMTEEKKSALILGAHPGLSEDERWARQTWDREQASRLLDESMETFRARWSQLPILTRVRRDTREENARLELGRSKLRVEGLAWAMNVLGSGSMPPCLDRLLRTPHRIVWAAGDSDAKYLNLAEELHRHSSRWSYQSISESGHSCHLDNPLRVCALIRDLEQAA